MKIIQDGFRTLQTWLFWGQGCYQGVFYTLRPLGGPTEKDRVPTHHRCRYFLNIYEEDTYTQTNGHGSMDVMLQIVSVFAVTNKVG